MKRTLTSPFSVPEHKTKKSSISLFYPFLKVPSILTVLCIVGISVAWIACVRGLSSVARIGGSSGSAGSRAVASGGE